MKSQNLKNEAKSPSETACHSFGDRRYLYWDSCKGHSLYIRAKWTDFKEEMLNNSICSLSLPQWTCLWRKATIVHSTNRSLKTVAFKYWKMGSGVQIHAQRFGIKGTCCLLTYYAFYYFMYFHL